MKRVIDAEFEIVHDVRERRRPWPVRFGQWLVRVALTTFVAMAFTGVVGWLGLFVLGIDQGHLWILSTAILVAASAGWGFIRPSSRR